MSLHEPDPNTEAGRANLELQKRKPICYFCAGGGTIPAQIADRIVRVKGNPMAWHSMPSNLVKGRLQPVCRWHADEGNGEEYTILDGLKLILVEGIHES
jgi:hypothetical protein